MKVKDNIFRAYDIRGIVGEEIDDKVAWHTGKAFGSYMIRKGLKNLSVGMDCRLSSKDLKKNLVEGLLSAGCNVTDIGVCPTPLLYFSIVHLNLDGGVMITASHNPPEFNGFKLCVGRKTLFGDEIKKIKELIERENYEEGNGRFEERDVSEGYANFINETVKINRGIKIAIDGGNGTAGPLALKVFEKYGLDIIPLYCEMDGRFPNHHPDPVVEENIKDLRKVVVESGCDLGFGYDGDGDRLGVVDDRGRIVWGDKLLLIFAMDILERNPGAKIIGEVKCSQVLYDTIEKLGGIPIMWKTGHSYIKEKLDVEKGAVAGEMSGHIFFRDRYFGFDDAIYASARLLEIISKKGKSLSELLSNIPDTFNTPEIRIDCPDNIKFDVVERVRRKIKGGKVIDIDGIRTIYPDGSWALVRASNTQPALVLRFEAPTKERLEELRDSVISLIKKEINLLGG